MTYIILIIISSFFSISNYNKGRNYHIFILICLNSILIASFSFSDNFDHKNYIFYLENEVFNLVEPLFIVMMKIFSISGFRSEFFLVSTFITVSLFSFYKGNRLYLSNCLIYLGPIGVISPRFFFAAILLSLVIDKKKSALGLIPILTHYSTILPVSIFYFRPILIFSSLAIISGLYALFTSLFFDILTASLGIDYSRYQYGEISGVFSIGSIFKYFALPVVLLVFLIADGWKKEYFIIFQMFFISIFLKLVFIEIETVSRISSIFALLGIYYSFVRCIGPARVVVILYLIGHSILISIFGFNEFPEIYIQASSLIDLGRFF